MPAVQAEIRPPTMDDIVRRVNEIATLPQVAMRVMETANDANAGAADLKRAMENDPALCARVLRCVNSSAYGVRGQITNLQQAIAYLGMRQIRNLAMTAAVSKLFAGEEKLGAYSRPALWKHLVSVGICARLIAMRLSFMDFEDIFLAGLLHDIGLVVEDQHVHKAFAGVIRSLEEGKSLVDVEHDHLGFDHTTLGEAVAATWGFPGPVRAAARFHHAAQRCRDEEHIHVVRCVELANLICTAKGIPSVGMKLVAFSPATIEALCLGRDDVLVLADSLDHELSENASLLEI
jgi:HD-like signal output (HDOD) protein